MSLATVRFESGIASGTCRLENDLQDSLYELLFQILGDVLDLKDSETESHCERVTAYSVLIAKAMGLTSHEVKTLARGAFLHDIGKLAIPDCILQKPSKLTPEEQGIMQRHSERGYSILRGIPQVADVADIVRSHHERFDGQGYPQGLIGEMIPLGARVFSVADSFDAMTSDRPYRRALKIEIARAEIARCAGTQFDPRVVEAFMTIPERIWADLRQEVISHIFCDGPPK